MSIILFILAAIFIWQATLTYEIKTQSNIVFCFFVFNFAYMFYKFTYIGLFQMIFCFLWWCTLMYELDKQNNK